jgi:flagellar protein FliS
MNAQYAAGAAARSYETEAILAADPLALVVRVFEIARVNLDRARSALVAGDCAEKGLRVQRVLRCLEVLQTSLDMEQGGAVASNLDRLYDYLRRSLTEAHLHGDAAKLDEVGRHLEELLGAWREAASRQALGASVR